jgi:hypothetical protein
MVCQLFEAEMTDSFALGGGFGWLTGQHGLGCDQILGARMVLASGQVIDVTDTEHHDVGMARPIIHNYACGMLS